MAELAPVSTLRHLSDRMAAAGEAPATIRLAEVPHLTQLTLRVDPEIAAAAAVAATLGIEALPAPGTSARAGDLHVLWLGPDEWLVVAAGGDDGARLEERVRAAAAGAHASAIDVSAQRAIVEVAGAAARDVLLKGCSLDLHPRSFATGRCASTALARAAVILFQHSEEPAYWVFVQASFAEYVVEWLLDACAEYRGAPPLDLAGPRGRRSGRGI